LRNFPAGCGFGTRRDVTRHQPQRQRWRRHHPL